MSESRDRLLAEAEGLSYEAFLQQRADADAERQAEYEANQIKRLASMEGVSEEEAASMVEGPYNDGEITDPYRGDGPDPQDLTVSAPDSAETPEDAPADDSTSTGTTSSGSGSGSGSDGDAADEDLTGSPAAVSLHILDSNKMNWYRDSSSDKWYVTYGMANSSMEVLFEADPDQMDALFGVGARPDNFTDMSFTALVRGENITFSGNISEMEGEGNFDDEVAKVTALALDDGVLPSWASDSGAAMDIIYVAQAEQKSADWVLTKISELPQFKERFPHINQIMASGNLSLADSITGFLEYEAGVTQALSVSGLATDAVTPELIGSLIEGNHSLTEIATTTATFKRMQDYAPAMDAFNQILQQQGMAPITTIGGMFEFMNGEAPADVYEVYEASSLAEAAQGAGLGDVFSAEDAINAAISGDYSLESASAAFSSAANMLLRLRNEVDLGAYGLNADELIDINLGRVPQSGRNSAEIEDSIGRAIQSAKGSLKKRQSSLGNNTLAGLRQEG